jgi:hypothetical protein
MKDYRIVTVCTHYPEQDYYCLGEFIKSLQGEEILVLDREYSNYSGLGSKPKAVFRAIKEGLIDRKYIIFCDCWDLVFARHPDSLFRKYKEFAAPLVISSEKNCFPDDLKAEYDMIAKGSSPYRYLNSGMIVGETEAMLATLEAMDLANVPEDYWDNEKQCNVHINDQFLYQQIFLKRPVNIVLDTEQILCNTLHDVALDELDFGEEIIANKNTRSYPCSFHFNGGAKTGPCREPILKHLGL